MDGAGVEFRSTIGPATTVIVDVSVSDNAPPVPTFPPSFVTIVSVTEPAALAENCGALLARNALICATVPVRTMLLEPLPVTVTPPPEADVNVPDDTESVVVTGPDGRSGSAIARPISDSGDDVPAVNADGSVFTGASLTAVTAIVATAVLEFA